MLYMAKTVDIQADERIDCSGIAEVDASINPWALLEFAEDAAASEAGWRLVGAYPTESSALTARRRLSRSLRCADYDAIPSRLHRARQLPRRDAGPWNDPAAVNLGASN